MSTSEQRRARRKRIPEPVDVINVLDGESLGRIGNLSRDGMMLIGRRKLGNGALYQTRFQLPDPQGKPHVIEAGLRIISLSEAHAATLNAWLGEGEVLKVL